MSLLSLDISKTPPFVIRKYVRADRPTNKHKKIALRPPPPHTQKLRKDDLKKVAWFVVREFVAMQGVMSSMAGMIGSVVRMPRIRI